MSELKVINAYQLTTNTEDSDVYIHNDDFCCGGDLVECYLKSEADKVIANRDYEIKSLKDSIGRLLKANTEQVIAEVMQKALIYGEGFVRVEDVMKLIAELCHHKYKRCLDKAEWCESKVYHIRRTPLCDMSENEYWQYENDFWQRWHNRWLGLAEKFKEAK